MIGDDILDTREVQERIEELETWDKDPEELKSLQKFKSELEGYCEWDCGDTLINESHFIAYAEQLAEELGMVKRHENWPNNHIDWEAAAEELKMDYTYANCDGGTYYVRCQ